MNGTNATNVNATNATLADPPAQEEEKQEEKKKEEEDDGQVTTQNRFRDNEELRYSLRSIWRYAPWVPT